MKVNDYIGIGDSTGKLSLVCQITEITKDHVAFWVINGCWSGYLKQNGTVDAGTLYNGEFNLVNTTFGNNVLFTGSVPQNLVRFGEYQELFDYMDNYLKCSWFTRKYTDVVVAYSNRKTTALKRLKLALTAFNDSWQGRGHHTTEDTIPF